MATDSNTHKTRVLDRGYDLAGNSTGRVLRHWLRIKTMVMGNYDTGPGLKCLVTLWLLHHFGAPLFRLRVWLNNQYALRAKLRGLIKRIKG